MFGGGKGRQDPAFSSMVSYIEGKKFKHFKKHIPIVKKKSYYQI